MLAGLENRFKEPIGFLSFKKPKNPQKSKFCFLGFQLQIMFNDHILMVF